MAPSNASATPGASSYAVLVDETNFQSVLEASMTAAVLLAFYSPTKSPESAQLAEDLKTLADEFEGRYLCPRPGSAQRHHNVLHFYPGRGVL